MPVPEQQRVVAERIAGLMANDGKSDANPEDLPLATERIQ
jgi:hypothetical protein